MKICIKWWYALRRKIKRSQGIERHGGHVYFTQMGREALFQEGTSEQRPNEGWSHAGVWRENIPEPEAACVKALSWGCAVLGLPQKPHGGLWLGQGVSGAGGGRVVEKSTALVTTTV